MSDHTYCRTSLALNMKDVKRYVPKDVRDTAWGYKYAGCDAVEMHIPGRRGEYGVTGEVVTSFKANTGKFGPEFYWHGTGCCVTSAKDQGWDHYMQERFPWLYEMMNLQAEGHDIELGSIDASKKAHWGANNYIATYRYTFGARRHKDGSVAEGSLHKTVVAFIQRGLYANAGGKHEWKVNVTAKAKELYNIDSGWLQSQTFPTKAKAAAALLAELSR